MSGLINYLRYRRMQNNRNQNKSAKASNMDLDALVKFNLANSAKQAELDLPVVKQVSWADLQEKHEKEMREVAAQQKKLDKANKDAGKV